MKIRGRIIEIESQKYLLSGLRYIRLENCKNSMADIIEAEGELSGEVFLITGERLLTKGKLPGGAGNWKKALYDTGFKSRMIRSQLLYAQVRSFFWKEGFLEISTPVLSRYAAMEPTIDSLKASLGDEDLYMHTSPEYFMKKTLVAGLADNIFQICPVFRKDRPGRLHNPEFRMLEWYRNYEPYETLMDDCLGLLKYLAEGDMLTYQGHEISLGSYEKLTVEEALRKYADTDFNEIGVYEERAGWKDLFYTILINDIEPKLGFDRPVMLCEYPAQMAALAKRKPEDSRVSKRFEMYVAGIEIANCFEELTDHLEQKSRFENEKVVRQKNGSDVYDIDVTFLEALEAGMPPASGGALGLDRLFMILADCNNLKETMLFPHGDV